MPDLRQRSAAPFTAADGGGAAALAARPRGAAGLPCSGALVRALVAAASLALVSSLGHLSIGASRARQLARQRASAAEAGGPRRAEAVKLPPLLRRAPCARGDAFAGQPVDNWTPPDGAADAARAAWREAYDGMRARLKAANIGGAPLRELISVEVHALRELRHGLFCDALPAR